MKIPSFRTLALVGALTAGAGFYGYFYGQANADLNNAKALAAAYTARPILPVVKQQAVSSASAGAQATSVASVAAQAKTPAPLAVSDKVRSVLPNLTQIPNDWRTFQPSQITVCPIPNLPIDFVATSVRQEGDMTIWTGKSAVDNGNLVAVSTKDNWNAIASFPNGNEYRMHVGGTGAVVVELNPDHSACGNDLVSNIRQAAADQKVRVEASLLPGAEADLNTVDVLFLYDADVVAVATKVIAEQKLTQTPVEQIETSIRAIVELCNIDLTNSKITNLKWNVTAIAQIPAYDIKGDVSMNADLSIISDTKTEVGKFVDQKGIDSGADQAVLYIGTNRTYSGLAWTPGHQAVCLWQTTHITAAHEMAHNFGCSHDRKTEGVADNNGKYSYGFMWIEPSGRSAGTIMSYAAYVIPYFSNPDITVDGVVIGVAEGLPNAANNARVIRDNAASMSGYRSQLEVPVITTQPAGASITEAQTISLSVTATGGALTYQWYKGESAISGATSSSFSKYSATTADAGSYTVIVKNIKGSAQSNTASINVSAASNGGGNNPPAGGSSGGGGGGGSPSFLFYAALALLTGARRFGKK